MAVKISIDTNTVRLRIKKATEKSLLECMEQILSDCNKYCPEDTGTLIDGSASGSTVIGGEQPAMALYWPPPYARYLYYGMLMVDPDTLSPYAQKNSSKILTNTSLTYTKPEACKLWCEKAREVYGEEWRELLEKSMRKRL